MDECANNQYATARCRPEAEADNRVVAEGEDGYFSGTTGLPVGLHSNSFHHVSKSVNETMKQCLDLLKPGGFLVGIEPFGIISTIFAGIIYVVPDVVISLIPGKMKHYIHAIKYECKNEKVIYCSSTINNVDICN